MSKFEPANLKKVRATASPYCTYRVQLFMWIKDVIFLKIDNRYRPPVVKFVPASYVYQME